MIVYYCDYSERDGQRIAWIKKTNARRRKKEESLTLPRGKFINGSFSGELLAIYLALVDAIVCGYSNIEIKSDGKFAIESINSKTYKPKKADAKFIHLLINHAKSKIKKVKFTWIPREENTLADSLSKRREE